MATILAIDDDANSLTTIAEGLRAAGHQVVTSQQASTASALAAEHRVDAVILEIRMPDLSGYEVLQALRSQPMTGGVPILLLSASSAPAHRIRSLRAGADDFLAKPFATEELMLRLDLLLDQRPRNLGSPPLESPPESAATRPTATGENLMDTPGGEVTLMGRYQVLEVIGQGAMGVVYRGWDPRLRRPVALKTLRFDHPGEQDRKLNISRLLAEAITVARFSDPNIVAVYDVGEGPDSAFIAMELVDGASLDSVLSRQAKLPVDQVIALGIAISRGLAAAHAQGVVHRDVKPGNVLLGRDRSIKVTDFGVALMMSSLASGEGKIFGTPGYLPPETLMSEGYGEAGDLFGLGVILYQCLTGERAFRGSNIHQRMVSTLNDVIIPPSALVADVPEELDHLLLHLLEKKPEDRLADARETAARLTAIGGPGLDWAPPMDALEHRVQGPAEEAESVLVEPLEN